MAYISTFVYCENIQNEPSPNGSKLHVIGPMQIMTPAFIPSMFSFSVVFGILDIQLNKPHTLRYIFKGPKAEEQPIIDSGDIVLPIQENNAELPDEMKGFMMNMDFRNIPLQYEGEYTSEIYFDEVSLGMFPIKVKAVMK